jgi:threonine dehydrogenase-like Zn-dependent dehydrogenase
MRLPRAQSPADDRGSVLILGVGLTAACLLALVVMVDASAAFLQRRQLLAVADAAALAGAQSIDLPAYYAEGASTATRLDVGGLPRRVRAHVARASGPEDATVDRVESDGRLVVVGMSSPLRLPFLSALFPGRITVEARAQLAYRAGGS